MSPRRIGALLLAILVALVTIAAPAFAAGSSRLSLPQVQQDFMCTICHEPLNEARSDEAYQENGILRQLIAQGDGLPQIKHVMVSDYGPGVLADPPAHGFDLIAYVIPVVVITLGVITIAVTIPRWRRRATRQNTEHPANPTESQLSDEDSRRLDADLARQS